MDVLAKLGLDQHNLGTCAGIDHWLESADGMIETSINPATGRALADVATCGAKDYEQVLSASEDAFRTWRHVPAPKRAELVRRIAESLREQKDELGSLIALEMGKIKAEGDGEVQEMIDMADFCIGQARMLYGKVMQSERPQHRMMEQWHPLGVVGVITAFNFPMAVWAWNAFLAAICGNTVIWKPSRYTPLCAIAVQQICNRAMRELDCDGVFTLLFPGDSTTTQRLPADLRVPLVSFTGSTAVGKKIAATVASRFGRTILECSGNNAIIVDAGADLNLALRAIVFGAVGTAGQRCTTTRRLFIHERVYDELVQRLINAYRQIRIGDPLESTTIMGPLINPDAVTAFERAVAQAKEQGGDILSGGSRMRRAGFFVEPTLIAMKQQSAIMHEETFAPILYVMPWRELDEAIMLQNAVPQGLSSAIFTNDLRCAERFIANSGSDCGIANVNIGTSGAEIGGAFGGEKETGGGREAGSDCWKYYMRRQTNTINWGEDLPLAQGIQFGIS